MYDAVYLASDELMQKQQGRKAVVVLSDGVDTGSKETLEEAIESAQRANTVVYSILFKDDDAYGNGGGFGRTGISIPGMGGPGMGAAGMGGGGRGGRRFPEQHADGKKVLERISNETGGRLFEVSKKESVDQIYSQIQEELRNQYSLGYTPDRAGTARVGLSQDSGRGEAERCDRASPRGILRRLTCSCCPGIDCLRLLTHFCDDVSMLTGVSACLDPCAAAVTGVIAFR